MSNSYFKVSYRSNKNGYFEEITPKTEEEEKYLYDLYKRCQKEGAIMKTDPAAQALIQTLLNNPDCPPAFKRDGINGIHIEFRTLSSVM